MAFPSLKKLALEPLPEGYTRSYIEYYHNLDERKQAYWHEGYSVNKGDIVDALQVNIKPTNVSNPDLPTVGITIAIFTHRADALHSWNVMYTGESKPHMLDIGERSFVNNEPLDSHQVIYFCLSNTITLLGQCLSDQVIPDDLSMIEDYLRFLMAQLARGFK